jgi:thioredoxin 1
MRFAVGAPPSAARQARAARGTLHGMNGTEPLRVTCLCAQWCGTCRDYVAVFDQARSQFAAAAEFAWVDIEDDADRLGEIEVENFPTLLIARGDRVLFFGPLTPQPQLLARLVRSALDGELPPQAPNPPLDAFVAGA